MYKKILVNSDVVPTYGARRAVVAGEAVAPHHSSEKVHIFFKKGSTLFSKIRSYMFVKLFQPFAKKSIIVMYLHINIIMFFSLAFLYLYFFGWAENFGK